MLRGFYASLFLGAIAAVIWGLTVAFAGLDSTDPTFMNNSRWTLLGVWVFSFVLASAYYSLKSKN